MIDETCAGYIGECDVCHERFVDPADVCRYYNETAKGMHERYSYAHKSCIPRVSRDVAVRVSVVTTTNRNSMSRDEFSRLLTEVIQPAECQVREQGQAEYAHDTTNAFANFDRLAVELNLTREQVLWIYLRKHLDGILSHINGNRSQREDVRGRIKDARLYLALLWGMEVARLGAVSPVDDKGKAQ